MFKMNKKTICKKKKDIFTYTYVCVYIYTFALDVFLINSHICFKHISLTYTVCFIYFLSLLCIFL